MRNKFIIFKCLGETYIDQWSISMMIYCLDEADIDHDGLIDYAEFFGMMTPGGKMLWNSTLQIILKTILCFLNSLLQGESKKSVICDAWRKIVPFFVQLSSLVFFQYFLKNCN